MTNLDALGKALQAYLFFGAAPPDVDPDTLVEFVRQGLSEISGQTSGKDPIIGGVKLLGELKIIAAKDTLLTAMKDNNEAVRSAASMALEKL